MRSTKLEINLKNLCNNIKEIKKYTNKEIMPVLKANAYGTYINKRIDIINQFKIVAVALVDEGIELRKTGYQKDILVLNQPSINEIKEIENNDLTIGISSLDFINKCIENNYSFKVHLEIETGMNRTGIQVEELNNYINRIKESKLKITGIYSHFSSADNDDKYSKMQIYQFKKALNICKKNNIKLEYIHMSASSGLLKYKLPFTNIVRPGILIYGYEPYNHISKDIKIKPICKLISEITFIKKVPSGTKIGYSGKYVCKKETIVATIPIGYGDGLRRILSDDGYVLINNKKAKIIGNICMDSIMVDITKIQAKIGDKVIIFDENNITLNMIAKKCNTINYEILCNIGNRVPRVFVNN